MEIIVDSDGILWLNEKHRRKVRPKTIVDDYRKYISDHSKLKYELVHEPKSNATEFL